MRELFRLNSQSLTVLDLCSTHVDVFRYVASALEECANLKDLMLFILVSEEELQRINPPTWPTRRLKLTKLEVTFDDEDETNQGPPIRLHELISVCPELKFVRICYYEGSALLDILRSGYEHCPGLLRLDYLTSWGFSTYDDMLGDIPETIPETASGLRRLRLRGNFHGLDDVLSRIFERSHSTLESLDMDNSVTAPRFGCWKTLGDAGPSGLRKLVLSGAQAF